MYSLYLKHYTGYKTSGKQFHEVCSDTFHIEGFTPCEADSDIWTRCNGNTYEYVTIYVDDWLCAMKDPRSYLNSLIKYTNTNLTTLLPLRM